MPPDGHRCHGLRGAAWWTTGPRCKRRGSRSSGLHVLVGRHTPDKQKNVIANISAGIATGPVIGSLVGIPKYVYDVFGPAINVAARLEGAAEPMQIVAADSTAALIRDDFRLAPLGEVELKGFGTRVVFSLDAEARKGR